MIRTVLVAAPLAFFACVAVAAGECPLTEQNLIGGWKRASDGGFFEVMSFEVDGKDRRFNSWMDRRPEFIDAAWKLEKCRIVITHREPSLSVTFAVKRASPQRLYLVEEGEKERLSTAVSRSVNLDLSGRPRVRGATP